MSKIDRMLEGMKDYKVNHNEAGEKMETEEKERLLGSIMDKIEREKASEKKGDGRDVKNRNRKGFKKKSRLTKIAAAIAVVFITGNVVVVGATMLHLNEKFLSYFRQEEVNDVELENNYTIVDVEAENKGVTIQVDQVLGDDHGFYALFQVKGVKNPERILEPGFRDYEVNIKELGDEIPISYSVIKLYDDKEDEFSFMLKVNSQNLTGKEICFTLKEFGDVSGDEFRKIVEGQWKLTWKLAYQNNAGKIDVNKNIDLYGGKYNWDSISISPLSISVSTTMLEQGIIHQSDDESVDLNDEFYVDFADGTRLNKEYVDDDDIYIDGSDISMNFHSIRKYDDIVSVTFAGVTIPIHPDKQQHKKTYLNNEMKFSLQMSDELSDMVTVSEVKSYKDEGLKTNAQYVSFVGKKDDAEMTLFSIYRFRGVISPDELEEAAPFMTYLTSRDGYTYVIEYGEIVSEEQMVFVDILNQEISGIKHFLNILSSSL
ncbi:MAG: DUF4179 domain-containing protein [bacterium]|nr:DUF4179 domain-containing protein [bacterium]